MAGPDRVPHARSRQYHPTQMPHIIVTPRGSSSSSSPQSPTKQPPRPQNAWILYRQWALTKLLQEEPELKGVPQAQLSKRLGTMWKEENAEVRGFFEHEANVRKEQHAVEHPNYVFKPVKRSIKEREREERKREKVREKEAAKLEKQRRRTERRHSVSSSDAESRYGSPFGDNGPSPPLTACPSRGGTPEPLDLHSEHASDMTMVSAANGYATKSGLSRCDYRTPSSFMAESPISSTFPALINPVSSAKLAFFADSLPSPPDSLSPVSPLFPTPDIMPSNFHGNNVPSIIIADSFNDLCPNPLDAFEFEGNSGFMQKDARPSMPIHNAMLSFKNS